MRTGKRYSTLDTTALCKLSDPELAKEASALDAEERLELASTFERWASELRCSVGRESQTPLLFSGPAPKCEPGRGWIAVNMSAVDVVEMKKLVRAYGWTFQLYCKYALREAMWKLWENLGLSWRQSKNLTPGQIKQLAQRSELIRAIDRNFAPEKN
jgi:hypothetical protein